MKYTLRGFQKKRGRELLDELWNASSELARSTKYQAITLSAPTASGKTVIMTSLIERVLFGKGGLEDYDNPEIGTIPDAVFLWLSDSPQLNRQSLEKMSAAGSSELASRLEFVEADFDAEYFIPGQVYFLNSQKLSVAGILTNKEKGDLRNFTIWETINNSIARQKTRFYVVIDEAHRGMRKTANEQAQAATIIQKFILGSANEMDPSPLVIGMSATPQLFDALLTGASRTRRAIDIPAAEPREEGLIKDFILISHKDAKRPTEWTLLKAACKAFSDISEEWRRYCRDNNEEQTVRPVLVVQVEDASAGHSESRTSLVNVLDTIVTNVPGLTYANFAHCLESGGTLRVGDVDVRYVEPHRIEYDVAVRVVLFKMALTTGWDCPRAEVMMSFRRADDATYIAQLVGRIVRTPLARRMEGNDLLNSVMLFLPYYDQEEVKNVIDKLQGDSGESKGADAGEAGDFQTLIASKGKEKLLELYRTLPTYASPDGRKIADIRRALRLAFELAVDGWDAESDSIRKALRKKLLDIGEQRRNQGKLTTAVENLSTVTYRLLVVENGVPKLDEEGEQRSLAITEHDVENVFTRSFLTLTEELARSYITGRYDPEDPNALLWKLKLEVFLLSQDVSVVRELEEEAQKIIEEAYDKKKMQIKNSLPPERQAAYKRIIQVSRHFEATEPTVPIPVRLKSDDDAVVLPEHLLVDQNAEFKAKLNTWEKPVFAAAKAEKGFLGWLRNYPRKSWSIAYVYEYKGQQKPGYPDFVVFREEHGQQVVDLLEPHRGEDSLAKAHGLCNFAEAHGDSFGRIDWIRLEGQQLWRLNLNSPTIRKQVLAATVDGALETLFKTIGRSETAIS